jgi:hypothetical protein
MNKLLFVSFGTAFAVLAQAQLLGPTPYLSQADSPWTGLAGFEYFHLDNFQTGAQTAPGVVASSGSVIGIQQWGSLVDSVDGDDGLINGTCANGNSWFQNPGATGVTWTFNAGTLGKLPTHAGIVWTDGAGIVSFEAFDANGTSLGTRTGDHADNSFSGTVGEDRFYGMVHAGGISKIRISNSGGGGMELDHLQFGYNPVPEPATLIALTVGATALVRRRRAR